MASAPPAPSHAEADDATMAPLGEKKEKGKEAQKKGSAKAKRRKAKAVEKAMAVSARRVTKKRRQNAKSETKKTLKTLWK